MIGLSDLQFTKEGSVFVSVRWMPEEEEVHGSEAQFSASGRKEFQKDSTGHRSGRLDRILENRELYPMVSSKRSQVSQENGFWSPEDEKVQKEVDSMAPRLSMQPGALSTDEAVDRWRCWKPLTPLESPDSGRHTSMTLVFSVEDTGEDVCLT